jgi:hypothetical protein
MIDWDVAVLQPNFTVFGEPANYQPVIGDPFDIDIVFDRPYTREYLLEDGSTGWTSVSPTAGIRLVQFVVDPQQNDRIFVPRLALTFIVRDCRPDSHGGARLFLNRVADTGQVNRVPAFPRV